MTRRFLLKFFGLGAVLAAAGCAQPVKPLAPVDDRLGTVNDLLKSQNDHVDAAAASNDATLNRIRRARNLIRQ